jgi:hypothetical protein
LTRSVAWDSGWTATVSVDGGKAKAIPVKDFDLVQQVRIPAGDDVVSFHYKPRHLLLASILTLGAIVFLLALFVVCLLRVLRRRGSEPAVGVPPDDEGAEGSPAAVPTPVG